MCRNTCFQSELLLLLTSASSSRSKSPLTKFLFPVQQLLHCNFVTFSSINYTELNCLTINNVFQAFNHLRVFKSQRHSRSIHSLKQQCQKQARAPTTAGEERTQPSPRRHALPPPCCDALHAAQDAAWRFQHQQLRRPGASGSPQPAARFAGELRLLPGGSEQLSSQTAP